MKTIDTTGEHSLEQLMERMRSANATTGQFLQTDATLLRERVHQMPSGQEITPFNVRVSETKIRERIIQEFEATYRDGSLLVLERSVTAEPLSDSFGLIELPAGTPLEIHLSFEATNPQMDVAVWLRTKVPHADGPVAFAAGAALPIDPVNPSLEQVSAMEDLATRLQPLVG